MQQNGFFIKVRVDKIPINCKFSTKKRIKAFFEFEYNGKNHSKNLIEQERLVDEIIGHQKELQKELQKFENISVYVEEIKKYLDKKIPLEQAFEETFIRTRRYVKRQRTWFRGHMKEWTSIFNPNFDILTKKIINLVTSS